MHEEGGTGSPLKIFGNVFISFVGAGVLGLPSAFKESGILEGLLIMSFVGFVSVKAMLLLIDCKIELGKRPDVKKKFKVVSLEPGGHEEEAMLAENYTNKVNGQSTRSENSNGDVQSKDTEEFQQPKHEIDYGDIAFYAIGDIGKLTVDISIIVSQTAVKWVPVRFFVCLSDIYINNMTTIYPSISVNQWVASMIFPLLMLCMLRHLHKLAIFSLFADFSNVLAYSVVFWFDFEHIQSVSSRLHPKEFSLAGFPFFLGISFYCYEGAGLICYLDASVSPEARAKFRPLFKFVLCLVTLLYMTFGICGYLSFGEHTESIITLNLPQAIAEFPIRSLPHNFARTNASDSQGVSVFFLFFTYPVAMFPVVSTIERRLKMDPVKNRTFGNFIRLVMVLTTAMVVIVIPSFTTLMALVGATCCTLLAFILPGIFHLKIFEGSISLSAKVLDYTLIVLGIIANFSQDSLQHCSKETFIIAVVKVHSYQFSLFLHVRAVSSNVVSYQNHSGDNGCRQKVISRRRRQFSGIQHLMTTEEYLYDIGHKRIKRSSNMQSQERKRGRCWLNSIHRLKSSTQLHSSTYLAMLPTSVQTGSRYGAMTYQWIEEFDYYPFQTSLNLM
ncbi:putative proton-coupled amino acid transporter 3 isoform X2 [Apostichopus japonicus]|uniref:Putative proton-coupled amino acid transporter 3 isoform X2 n=1 Tax=Stichopus japonicus TaxID=307972 RepID=A0A2G8KNZ1_STIJA|nr:putative proton-coupled amino acid transporter 3 isoform X2 [Apostichopus japonicus]